MCHSHDLYVRFLCVRLPFLCDGSFTRRTFPLPARTVHLPSFDGSAKAMRKNDRFAYGSMTAMGVSGHACQFGMNGYHNRLNTFCLQPLWLVRLQN